MTDKKLLNKNQTELRRVLEHAQAYPDAIQQFPNQHATLHSKEVSNSNLPSYEDEILDNITELQFRRIPDKCEHSIAWCIWHITRIEDAAMNLVVAGLPQVFNESNWQKKINTEFIDTGNNMSEEEIMRLSSQIDFQAMREYRMEVGQRTREIAAELTTDRLKEKTQSDRLLRVLNERAVRPEASGVVEYWSRRDIAGMLLMPASRHILVHLNEAAQLKNHKYSSVTERKSFLTQINR